MLSALKQTSAYGKIWCMARHRVRLVAVATFLYLVHAHGVAALETPDILVAARDGMAKAGLDKDRFTLRSPRRGAKPHTWWVFAILKPTTTRDTDRRFTSTAPVDGDLLIVVTENPVSTCVQQAIAPGPCI